jgi:UDP-N-acetylglucosamine enolpyruvyl transferase
VRGGRRRVGIYGGFEIGNRFSGVHLNFCHCIGFEIPSGLCNEALGDDLNNQVSRCAIRSRRMKK